VNPDVSICIPYFERGPEFERTLWSFIQRGYFSSNSPLSIEVSVCDDGSIDEPVRDLAALQSIPSGCLKLTELPTKDKWMSATTPINTAIANARAPFIVLQSPETMHPTPVVFEQAKLMTATEDVISAPTIAPNDKRVQHTNYWYAHPEHRQGHLWWCQMFTWEFWDRIGGVDERYRQDRGWEDIDLLYTFRAAGANFKWSDPETAYAETVYLGKSEEGGRRHRTHKKSGRHPMSTENPNFILFHEKWGKDKPKGF